MTTITRTVQIDASPDQVWPALADFGGIATWNPGVRRSYTVGDLSTGPGAERVCEFPQFGASVEEVVADWDEGRSLTVHIVKGHRLPPFKGHAEAHFELEPTADGRTTVTATMSYELKGGPLGRVLDANMARRQLGTGFTGLLAGLKHHVETGETVEDTSGLELNAVTG